MSWAIAVLYSARQRLICSASGISSLSHARSWAYCVTWRRAALRCFRSRFRLLQAVKNPASLWKHPQSRKALLYLGPPLSKVNPSGVISCIGISSASSATLWPSVPSMRTVLSPCLSLVRPMEVSRSSPCKRPCRINASCSWRMTRPICKLRNARPWPSV